MHGTHRPAWFPDWSNEVCAVVASGPSTTREEVEALRGRCRVAVVNNNHELAPWADVLYAADPQWWDQYPAARQFAGLKVAPKEAPAKTYGLNLVTLRGEVDTDADRIIVDTPGQIARGGNSAFQLVNLVTQFGCRRQMWMGFDFCGEHWHGNHPAPLKNPRQHTLDKWRRRFDDQAKTLRRLEVEVINISPVSLLSAYPKMTSREALAHWDLA